MERSQLLSQLDLERRTVAYDGLVLESAPPVTRMYAADGSHRSVIYSSLNESDANAIIEREIGHHRVLDVSFEWKLYAHDKPADLRNRLGSRGFAIGPREAVLIFDLTPIKDWVQEHAGIVVRRTDDEGVIQDFRRVAEEVFGKDYSYTARQLLDSMRTGSTQHRGYVAYDRDQPVSIGRLYTHPASLFGGLFGGGTIASHRGRGFYRANVAARARDAIGLGARFLLIDALPTSRPIVELLGFVHLTDTWPCEWTPA